jgi:uncharacterized linocin/CFP29 family protein
MPVDLIQNMGGAALDLLIENDMDVNVLRPYREADGQSYVTRMIRNSAGVYEPRVLRTNAPATLPKDVWVALDDVVVKAIREELRAFADIRGAGLTLNLPNGMAHTMLQYQTQGDITPATVSMDPIRRGEADRPTTDYANLPLPIIHKDFDFSAREILTSRQGNMPLDTNNAELAARKIAEELEKMTVGSVTPFSYGGAAVYGYMTLPQRATKTDMPVPDGTNGPAVVTALLTLRQMLINNKHKGPYMMYVNSQWAQVLDNDFATGKGDNTLRQRILAIEDIKAIRTLDTLPTTQWHVLLVEMTTATVRAVVGMEVQTVQWESLGGMMKHYKVMCMLVPQLRPDAGGNAGVAHGRTV